MNNPNNVYDDDVVVTFSVSFCSFVCVLDFFVVCVGFYICIYGTVIRRKKLNLSFVVGAMASHFSHILYTKLLVQHE